MTLVPRLAPHTEATLHQFLRAHAGAPGSKGVVVGLSGGLDSALALRLARDALGPAQVRALLLPGKGYPRELLEECEEYARSLGVPSRRFSLDELEAASRRLLPEIEDRVTLGNITARLRMIVLYARAREEGRLVLGTGNKSELLLGYFTKYGDGGVDLLPLGDLYKTQERALAESLEVPAAVLARHPTAGFWEGQTDEGELGLPYATIDQILFGLEQLRTPEEIAAVGGFPPGAVRAVIDRVARHRHKRRLPPIPKLSLRTVGIDWRD